MGANGRYLRLEDVAEDFLRCSPRSVHELTRRNAIPLRRIPGVRRVLFVEDELRAWIDGAELEVIDGGRVVRPKGKP
jgi:predicted DNA-binding transcriptional regulator AlpA